MAKPDPDWRQRRAEFYAKERRREAAKTAARQARKKHDGEWAATFAKTKEGR
jgi:hypothetical protein